MADRDAVVRRLRDAGSVLRALPDGEILSGIGAALDRVRGVQGLGGEAARDLAAERGQSEAMLRYGLERMFRAHEREPLTAWLADARAEAGRILARRAPELVSSELEELRGPAVIAQILAGNVAALAIPAVLEGLLARSAVLLKPAQGDRVTPALLVEALRQADPRLGAAVEIVAWRGGEAAHESWVFNAVDFVVASGGEAMSESLSRRAGVPRYLYGPRFSVGMVGMHWMEAPPEWWADIAREICLWDQEGCLSPRILFVAGDPERFARRLSGAMAFWESCWPARPRPADEAAAVHAFRVPYELAAPEHGGCLRPEGVAWTVVWDHAPSLAVGPAARLVRVTLRPGPREMEALLERGRGVLQGIGLDHLGPADLDWTRGVDRAGISWKAPLSRIQDPPAGWRADGRSGLAELLASGKPMG